MSKHNELLTSEDLKRPARRVRWRVRAAVENVRGPKAVYFLVALTVTLLFFFPFYWLLKIAMTWPTQTLYGSAPSLSFPSPEIYNFVRVFFAIDFLQFLENSVIITLMAVGGTVIINSLAGYALRLDFYGKRVVLLSLVAALFVPTFVSILPLYLISDQLGVLNTHLGVALPMMAGIVGTLIFKNSFEAVPDSTIESARLDGATELYIIFGVLWPLSKAAIAVNVILTFIAAWNAYLWPLVIISDRAMYPLPLALATFTNRFQGNFAVAYAFALLVLLPAIVVFVLLQRQFIGSVVYSTLKE